MSPRTTDATRSLVTRASLLLAAAAAARLVATLFEAKPLAGELAAVLAVNWFAARAGASWQADTPARTWRGWALGAGLGALAVLSASAVALLIGAGRLVASEPSVMTLGLGLLHALAVGVRDELLFRWAPAQVFRAAAPRSLVWALCVALGAAPVALSGGRSAALLALSQGALSVALLRRGSGFCALAGANAAQVFLTSAVLSSTLELRFSSGTLSPLSTASGPGAHLLAGALALVAVVCWLAPNTEPPDPRPFTPPA